MRVLFAIACLTCVLLSLPAQERVDPRNRYERIIVIEPITGSGAASDGRRPQHAPAAVAARFNGKPGILAYYFQESDDGKTALVEYVALDRAAFKDILAAPGIKVFQPHLHKKSDIEVELKKYKRNFDFNTFGVRMP